MMTISALWIEYLTCGYPLWLLCAAPEPIFFKDGRTFSLNKEALGVIKGNIQH
jgi:hypothetical protein